MMRTISCRCFIMIRRSFKRRSSASRICHTTNATIGAITIAETISHLFIGHPPQIRCTRSLAQRCTFDSARYTSHRMACCLRRPCSTTTRRACTPRPRSQASTQTRSQTSPPPPLVRAAASARFRARDTRVSAATTFLAAARRVTRRVARRIRGAATIRRRRWLQATERQIARREHHRELHLDSLRSDFLPRTFSLARFTAARISASTSGSTTAPGRDCRK